MDASSPSINERSITIYKAIKEVRRSHISCQVNDVLHTSNSLFSSFIHKLPFNSLVLLFRKKNAGPIRIMKELIQPF